MVRSYLPTIEEKISRKVMSRKLTYVTTADNYAWVFNYNWFWHQWSTFNGDDGSHSKRSLAERDDDPISPDDSEDAKSEGNLNVTEASLPINVHLEGVDEHGTPLATFDYVGEDYDDFIVESKESFIAPNSDCVLS